LNDWIVLLRASAGPGFLEAHCKKSTMLNFILGLLVSDTVLWSGLTVS
jgi:hypothetical protein